MKIQFPKKLQKTRSRGLDSSPRLASFFAIALLLILLATPTLAQRGGTSFEITPNIGYQFGGDYEFDDIDFGYTEIEVEDSDSLGLMIDIPISRAFQIELFYARHDTNLEIAEGVGTLADPRADLEFFHAGVLWQSNLGQVKPYFVLTAGATKIEPGLTRFDAEYEPSVGIGGGVKVMVNQHLGFRLDGRFLITTLDDGNNDFFDDYDDYYDDFDCCRGNDYDNIAQGRISAGLVLAF